MAAAPPPGARPTQPCAVPAGSGNSFRPGWCTVPLAQPRCYRARRGHPGSAELAESPLKREAAGQDHEVVRVGCGDRVPTERPALPVVDQEGFSPGDTGQFRNPSPRDQAISRAECVQDLRRRGEERDDPGRGGRSRPYQGTADRARSRMTGGRRRARQSATRRGRTVGAPSPSIAPPNSCILLTESGPVRPDPEPAHVRADQQGRVLERERVPPQPVEYGVEVRVLSPGPALEAATLPDVRASPPAGALERVALEAVVVPP